MATVLNTGTVVPAGTMEVAHYQSEGFAYVMPRAYPAVTRADLMARYPELDF